MEQRDFNGIAPEIINASEPHMACLFLVDTSGSMEGDPIQGLVDGLNQFKQQVCEDERTKAILDVAIVEFNSTVRVVQPFVPVQRMEPVMLTANGGTDMVGGLNLAIDMVTDRSRFYRTAGTEPYKPWIIMITDGYPSEPVDEIAMKIKTLDEQGKLRLWALGVEGFDKDVLLKLCDGKRVLRLKGYDFSGFFDWANKSMRSVSVSSPGETPQAAPLSNDVEIIQDWM